MTRRRGIQAGQGFFFRCGQPVPLVSESGGNCNAGHYMRAEDLLQIALNGMLLVLLSDVAPERVRWLWQGRIPLGKLSVIEGDPGLGKSTVTLDIAARVTRGALMPDETASDVSGPGGVVLLSAEDGLADTIRPRLDAAGADPVRVAALLSVREPGYSDRPPTIADLETIGDAIDHVRARLVVIDPLMAYLPSEINGNSDQDVRSVLMGLAALAEDRDVAIVLVRHLNKREGGNHVYRGGGSIGIIGAARAGLVVARDPADAQRRVLAVGKGNLAADLPSLAYTMESSGLGVRVRWEGESPLTAEELLDDGGRQQGGSATDGAFVWLLKALGEGERPARDVEAEARAQGFTAKALRRARERLGVQARREGGRQGYWLWNLPEEHSPQLTLLPAEDAPEVKDAPVPLRGIFDRRSDSGGDVTGADQEGEGSDSKDAPPAASGASGAPGASLNGADPDGPEGASC